MAEEGTTTEAAETVVTDSPDATETPPTPEVDWKAKAREWEKRAKENANARTELDKLKAAQLSTEERTAAERDQAVAERDQARAMLMRYEVATRFGITDPNDIDMVLTGADEDTLTRQAEWFIERTNAAKQSTNGLYVPAEGRNPSGPALNSDDLEGALKRKLNIK